jgi:hypothetical protein
MGCETIKIVYPVIITPDLPEAPERAPWADNGFVAVDENNQIISNSDARIFGNYVLDLKEYGEELRLWLEYYIESANDFDDKLTQ